MEKEKIIETAFPQVEKACTLWLVDMGVMLC
jgi:hypothetical protein